MGKPAVVLQLQRKQPDLQLVERLEQLLAEARAGKVVGMTAAVHYGGAAYEYFGFGSLVDNPDLGIAAAARLQRHFF